MSVRRTNSVRTKFAGLAATIALMLVASLAFGGRAEAQGALDLSNESTLSWTTTGGIGGVVYEIENVGTNPLKIYRVGFMSSTAGTHLVDIYYRTGGCFNNYPPTTFAASVLNSGWTFVGSATVALPATMVVQIPVDLNVSLPTSAKLGILINTTTATPRYASSSVLANVSNADLAIRGQGIKASTTQAAPGSPAGTPFGSGNVPRSIPTKVWYDYDQFPGTHISVESARVNNGGGLKLGQNTVQAVFKNMGTTALDNAPIHAEYSIDGGTTWTSSQLFSFPSFPVLSNQTATFALPWITTTVDERELQVRMVAPTNFGQGTVVNSKTYTPDVDIIDIGGSGTNGGLIQGPNTIFAIVKNESDWDFEGTSIPLQYSIDGGVIWTPSTPQSFTGGAALATNGGQQAFNFPSPQIFSNGSVNLKVRISPSFTDDPDTTDEYSESFLVGVTVHEMHQAAPMASATTAGLPFSITSYTVVRTNALYLASELTAAGIQPGQQIVGLGMLTGTGTTAFTADYQNVRLGLMHTTLTALPLSTLPLVSDFTNVFGPVTFTPSDVQPSTYRDMAFHTPFIWNGTDNIRLDMHYYNPTVGGGNMGTTMVSGLGVHRVTRSYNNGAVYPWEPTSVFGSTGTVPKIRLMTMPLSAVDLDVDSISFGASAPFSTGPSLGSNVVNATIKTLGSQPYTGTFSLEYSVDGGSNWVSNAPFQASGLTQLGNMQTVTFTVPWVVSAPIGPRSISIRFPTPVSGDPDLLDQLTEGFTPDADVDSVGLNLVPPQLNTPMTVEATVRNGGDFGLNSAPIQLRYRVTAGTTTGNWVNQAFVASTLASNNDTQTFSFTQQVTFPTQGNYAIEVEFETQVPGDPDATDSNIGLFSEIGVIIVDVGLAAFSSGKTTPPSASTNAFPLGMSGPASWGCMYTPTELGNASGDIVSFGWQNAIVGTRTWANVKYWMGQTVTVSPVVASTPYMSYFVGTPVLVYDGPLTVVSTAVDSFTRIPMTTPYSYDGASNLFIYAEFSGPGGSGGQWGRVYTGGSPLIEGYRLYNSTGITPSPSGVTNNYGIGASFGFTPPYNPGLRVSRGSATLLPGATDDLGLQVTAGSPMTINYSLVNSGASQNLSLTSITITSATNCTASVVGAAPTTVPFGGSPINLPISVSAASGTYSFDLNIVSNTAQPGAGTYTVSVTGTGFVNTNPVLLAPLGGGDKGILITELSNDQSTLPTTTSEYIELTNVGASPVDITGWLLFVYEAAGTTPYSGYPITLASATIPGSGTYVISDGTTILPGQGSVSNILWNTPASGGVVIVNPTTNSIVDAVFFGSSTPALVTVPIPGGPTLSLGAEWIGPTAADQVSQGSTRRIGVVDNNDASDWTWLSSHSFGAVNPGLTVPFGGGGALQISGTSPNFVVETVVGSDLTMVLRLDDVDSHQLIDFTISESTAGSLTATQAGFTNTFPMTTGAGSPQRVHVLQGTAGMPGSVVFNLSGSDNGAIPGSVSGTLEVKIGARTDVTAMSMTSDFVRVGGQKDFYRGQQDMPINVTFKNDNNFAVQLDALNFLVLDAVTETPLTGFTFQIVGGPIAVPANSVAGVPVVVHMDIDANASGTNDMACVLKLDSATAVDPVNPTTNPIVTVIDSGAATQPFQLFDGPAPQPMAITTTTLGPAVHSVPYSQSLQASGGSQVYTWSIASTSLDQLPTGLTLNAAGSVVIPASITGQPTTAATPGPYVITFNCSDGAYVATKTLTINVSALTALTFPPVTVPNGEEYVAFNMTTPFTATGGSLIYTYTVDPSGVDPLPAGLTLNPTTGFITGTPADGSQRAYTVTFLVDDGLSQQSQTQTFTINPHDLQWRSTTLPVATQTVAYSVMLDAIGGVNGRIYSITTGALPSGLTLNPATGEVSGVPTLTPPSAGTYNIEFTVTDGDTPPSEEPQTMTLIVEVAAPLVVTTSSLDYAMVGSAYMMQLASTGGSENYTYSLHATSDALPNGVTLSTSGELSGTPDIAADGRYNLVIQVDDGFQSTTQALSLAVLAKSADSFGLSEVDTGTGYIELTNDSQELIDVSGWSIRVWVDGVSPISLPFDTIPGASLALPGEVVQITIGGTAGGTWPHFSTGGSWVASSTSDVAVQLLDIAGNTIDFVAFGTVNRTALVDAANAAVEFPGTSATEPNEMNGSANYSFDGNGWAGAATGTPGVFNPGLAPLSLAIVKDSIRTAVSGESYFDFALAVGGTEPYTFTLAAPTAPWLSLSSTTGVFSGTVPTVTTETTIQMDVTVTDAASTVVTETFTLQIAPATTTASATFTVGNPEGQSFEGTVIDVPVTLTRAAGVTDVRGFGFVIELPSSTAAELAVVRVLPGQATLDSGRSVVARDIGNNSIYISDTDGLTSPLVGIDDGIVAIIRFMVPADDTVMAPEDTYPVNISNVEVGRDAQGAHVGAGVNGSMVLSNYKPQDVNRDNLIDVVDVQLTVNIILASFVPVYTGQGDANGDTIVDVVDVQTIVNCILLGGC